MANLRKIAKLAGVALSTVSLALRDDPRVKAETRKRIQTIADDLHYHPNTLARAVFSGQTYTVGVLIPMIGHPYWAKILEGILTEAYQSEYHVLVREITFGTGDVHLAIASFIEQRVDGVICAPIYFEPVFASGFLELKCHKIPMVGVDTLPGKLTMDQVVTDWHQLAEVAVRHLMELGHRHIALVGGMPNVPEPLTMGYAILQALQRHRLPVLHLGKRPSENFDEAFARTVLHEVVNRQPKPTALICWTDRDAARLVQQAYAMKIRIPQSLSILSCADSIVSMYAAPAITSIDQQPFTKGREAVRLLIERSTSPASDVQPMQRRIPCTLTVRQSCASPSRLM